MEIRIFNTRMYVRNMIKQRNIYSIYKDTFSRWWTTMKREEKIEMIQKIIEKKDPYIGLYAELLLSMGDMKLNYRDYIDGNKREYHK